jgi:hypothetical protein
MASSPTRSYDKFWNFQGVFLVLKGGNCPSQKLVGFHELDDGRGHG